LRPFADRDDLALVAFALAAFALAFLFSEFGYVVAGGGLRAFDVAVRDWVLAHHTSGATIFFELVTYLGAEQLLMPAGIVIGWFAFRGSGWLWLVLLVVYGFGSAEFVGWLKEVYWVGRPEGGLAHSRGLSFPSGHSSGAASMLTFFGYVLVRYGKPARVVVPVTILVIILVGISRIYLDKHWASDVFGGFLIGGAFGLGTCALYAIARRHQRGRHTRAEMRAAARQPPDAPVAERG
jgi:undecaprenyl-diphosphatase